MMHFGVLLALIVPTRGGEHQEVDRLDARLSRGHEYRVLRVGGLEERVQEHERVERADASTLILSILASGWRSFTGELGALSTAIGRVITTLVDCGGVRDVEPPRSVGRHLATTTRPTTLIASTGGDELLHDGEVHVVRD